jgi:AcrR family transcriptional regulator
MRESNNQKQADILSAARELFWKYGFKRVTTEEICRRANVSKMTFYRFFPNKTDLAKTVFDREIEKGILNFRSILQGNDEPAEKVKQILLMKFEGVNNISQEFLMDFYNNPELGLKSYIEEKSASAWQEILLDFKKAQQQGILRKDIKAEFILYVSQKTSEMISDNRLLKLYNSPQDLIMEFTNFFIYGVAGVKS